MSIEGFLNQTFTVERPSVVADSYGTVTKTWVVIMTVRGRMRFLVAWERGPIRIDWGREDVMTTHRLYLLGHPNVKETDRVVDSSGGIFYLDQINDPGSTGEHIEVDCWKERA